MQTEYCAIRIDDCALRVSQPSTCVADSWLLLTWVELQMAPQRHWGGARWCNVHGAFDPGCDTDSLRMPNNGAWQAALKTGTLRLHR